MDGTFRVGEWQVEPQLNDESLIVFCGEQGQRRAHAPETIAIDAFGRRSSPRRPSQLHLNADEGPRGVEADQVELPCGACRS